MREIQFREALREAMVEEMRKDDRIFLMGEEVAEYNGAYKVSQGMLEEFGKKRVIDTPIEFLGTENMFWAVVILEVLHLYPIMYLNLSSALSNVDPSLEEMAGTLGAGRLKKFRTIIWPLARPGPRPWRL